MSRLPLDAKDVLWEQVNYRPSEEQQHAHRSKSQHVLIIGGEGGGKSTSGSMELLPHALLMPYEVTRGGPRNMKLPQHVYRDRLYWLVGPEFEDCRPEFTYIVDALEILQSQLGDKLIQKLTFPDEGSCKVVCTTGTVIETRSAADPAKCMSGRGPQGIVYCEAGRLTQNIWERGLSRLARSEEPGAPGWSWGSGIVQESLPWFLDLYEQGQNADNPYDVTSYRMPSWTNPVTFPGGRADPKIQALERQLSRADFDERIAAKIAPPSDIVFPEFSRDVHVKPWKFQACLPGTQRKWAVTLAIDPGYDPGAYAVLAIQQDGRMVRVLDEIYAQRKTAEEVIEMVKAKPWWNNVVHGVIDPFGGTSHQAHDSQVELWQRLARIPVYAPNRRGFSILEGVRRYRSFLARGEARENYVTFDPACRNTIREHRLYRRQPSIEGRRLQVNPIDRDNHALKALIYWLWQVKGFAGQPVRSGPTRFSMV